MLKYPTIIVLLSISFLKSSKIFFIYLGAPMLGAYIFTMFVFLVVSSFEYCEVTFWVSLYGPSFEVCFVWYDYLLSLLFFPYPFAWKICFQPFTFSLCKSFVLRWVSCRQHICRLSFLAHSANLCLLIGAFNPFMFKVIIGRYLLTAIYFVTSFLSLSLSLSLSLFFLFLVAVPLASLALLAWWRCTLVTFFCLGSSLFLLSL